MEIFKDKNGKDSSKRIWGALAIFIGLVMGILKFWLDKENLVSDTLILGIIGFGFGAISVGTFEKKDK